MYRGVNEQGVAIATLPRDSRCCNGGLSLRSVKAMADVVGKGMEDRRMVHDFAAVLVQRERDDEIEERVP